MPELLSDDDIFVIRAGDLTRNTAQTPGMPRRVAVSPDYVSKRLWVGRVTGEPHLDSGPHHHGEAETVGFLLSGQVTILYGDKFEKSVELNPRDFV